MRAPLEQRLIASHAPTASAHKHEPSRLHAQMVASPHARSGYNRTNKLRPFCLMRPSCWIPLSPMAKVQPQAHSRRSRLERSPAKIVQSSMDDPARPRRSIRPFFPLVLALLASLPSAQAQSGITPHIEAIRFWSFGDVTRIAIQTQGSYQITSDQVDSPPRL